MYSLLLITLYFFFTGGNKTYLCIFYLFTMHTKYLLINISIAFLNKFFHVMVYVSTKYLNLYKLSYHKNVLNYKNYS